MIRKLKRSKEQIIIIGTPIHKNLGDHLIAEVEIDLLKDIFKNKKVIEIPTDIYTKYKRLIIPYVRQEAFVFITGGGWMGDLWPDDESRMQDIIRAFSKGKVFVLPQTLFFEDEKSEKSRRIIESARRTYSMCPQLTLMFRDKDSYDIAKKLYSDVVSRVILFPDMGLFKQYIINNQKKSDILICLREDREKVRNTELENTIIKYAEEHKIGVGFTTTLTKHGVPTWLRRIKINNKLREFEDYKMVVTDRLHGMIFAYLAGIKCVAIDNKTHKVSGVYNQWLAPNEAISVISEKSSSTELIAEISKMMEDRVNVEKNDMSEKIKELNKILRGYR